MLTQSWGRWRVWLLPFCLWFDCVKSCGHRTGYDNSTSDNFSEASKFGNLVWGFFVFFFCSCFFAVAKQRSLSIQFKCSSKQVYISKLGPRNAAWTHPTVTGRVWATAPQKRMSLHCKLWRPLCSVPPLFAHTSHSTLLQFLGKGIVSTLWPVLLVWNHIILSTVLRVTVLWSDSSCQLPSSSFCCDG